MRREQEAAAADAAAAGQRAPDSPCPSSRAQCAATGVCWRSAQRPGRSTPCTPPSSPLGTTSHPAKQTDVAPSGDGISAFLLLATALLSEVFLQLRLRLRPWATPCNRPSPRKPRPTTPRTRTPPPTLRPSAVPQEADGLVERWKKRRMRALSWAPPRGALSWAPQRRMRALSWAPPRGALSWAPQRRMRAPMPRRRHCHRHRRPALAVLRT